MTTYICFLRGVNVGGNKLLKMAELKVLFDTLKLRDAKTYLQSGNVVFRSDETDRAVLTRRIEDGIRKKSGMEVKIILRTTDELRKVIAANPLPPEDRNPSALVVAFLGGAIADTAKALLTSLKIPTEELHFGKQELYLYFSSGMADSKMSNALTEKKLGVNVTARNWNTVNALLKMGEEIGSTSRSPATVRR
ncbi:MAG TPA: DUF1697 domain-containing protein [Thermoanaerobaculia bacterium]|jgi:uncharacterized protein (DUF1697 family)|nr:DUF1697 domain-containing protein [Thermoanaerobaculia bacterium]